MSTDAIGAVSNNHFGSSVSSVSRVGNQHKEIDLKDNIFAADFGGSHVGKSGGIGETAGTLANNKSDGLFGETAGALASNDIHDKKFGETAGQLAHGGHLNLVA